MAKVVLSVRPGYEEAVLYYTETILVKVREKIAELKQRYDNEKNSEWAIAYSFGEDVVTVFVFIDGMVAVVNTLIKTGEKILSVFGKLGEWAKKIGKKAAEKLPKTVEELWAETKAIWSKYYTVKRLSRSKSGIEIACIIRGKAHLPLDKILLYCRGKIADVINKKSLIEEFYSLQKEKIASGLKGNLLKRYNDLRDLTHNPIRSLENKAILDRAGIPDTEEWNKKILDAILRKANLELPNQYGNIGSKAPVKVIVQGPKGKVVLDTKWEKIGYAKYWMNTIIVKPFK